jgi:hypothetical protein
VGRIADRTGMDPETRLRLLEGDMDSLERKVDEGFAALDKRFDKVQALITTVLVALVTASILLAINVVVLGHG